MRKLDQVVSKALFHCPGAWPASLTQILFDNNPESSVRADFSLGMSYVGVIVGAEISLGGGERSID